MPRRTTLLPSCAKSRSCSRPLFRSMSTDECSRPATVRSAGGPDLWHERTCIQRRRPAPRRYRPRSWRSYGCHGWGNLSDHRLPSPAQQFPSPPFCFGEAAVPPTALVAITMAVDPRNFLRVMPSAMSSTSRSPKAAVDCRKSLISTTQAGRLEAPRSNVKANRTDTRTHVALLATYGPTPALGTWHSQGCSALTHLARLFSLSPGGEPCRSRHWLPRISGVCSPRGKAIGLADVRATDVLFQRRPASSRTDSMPFPSTIVTRRFAGRS